METSLTCITGRTHILPVDADHLLDLTQVPDFVEAQGDAYSNRLFLKGKQNGRGIIKGRTARGPFKIHISVFGEREAFLITALSCNMHKGWDPSLHDRLPHRECCGPDRSGNAFIHVTRMERILHNAGLPVTWFLDPPSALEQLEYFKGGMERHGDEIAFMPSSYSHFNPVNFNTENTLEETRELIQKGARELEGLFGAPVKTLAVDQFIGSLGSHFVHAAAGLGFEALWGMGFDHFTCDTSMYHGGCPWNPYRPDNSDYRIPGRNPLPPWIFQWTFRDLINTVRTPGGASGAVMFSTDVDDILCTGIAANQSDYYHRLAREFLKNREHNDFLVMTIHQEDHDSWTEDGCAYYERFFKSLPEGFTPATMGEVARWLNVKHPYPSGAVQSLRLEDPLTCKDQVFFPHPDVRKPADWPSGGALYPPHIFHYDRDMQLIFEEGSPIPLRFIDYRKCHPVPETGSYPQESLPAVTDISIRSDGDILQYEFNSGGAFEGYPLGLWGAWSGPEESLVLPWGFVIFIDVVPGWNKGWVRTSKR
ncbi:MAG TPA: hypothetical protein PLB62_10125 [Candidatus Sumerlaeota bacterium]|nr:hypothetical protein [Candidatus Sumerlaeota bacterium]